MIHWLVQSTADDPCLERGVPPPHLLNAVESDRFRLLSCEKRRRDWLLGRWTAKRLVQAYLRQTAGKSLPLDELSIENDAARAPYVEWVSAEGRQRLPVSLSISHSHGRALCALVEDQPGAVGADIELVEARPPGFIEAYFNPPEAEIVLRAAEDNRPWLATAVWSAKEAVLKALHVGLSVDTFSVSCLPPATGGVQTGWMPFQVTADWRRLELPEVELYGWQRVVDGFVLSLALKIDGGTCSIKC